jgi:hypothetical protein
MFRLVVLAILAWSSAATTSTCDNAGTHPASYSVSKKGFECPHLLLGLCLRVFTPLT